ncbi:hypothetical protein GCM10008938_24280 [Deinococcus roseus]|uniref:Uncharacterized protein n=1 Tax=Deinococcus roseus TaxID=392414 RepID=A0ABQ2CZY7_9DEIO|nr:hypothetical protein GCM10008938_24280 [Deinococcus roseus]
MVLNPSRSPPENHLCAQIRILISRKNADEKNRKEDRMKNFKYKTKPLKFSFCIGAIRVAWNVNVPAVALQGD